MEDIDNLWFSLSLSNSVWTQGWHVITQLKRVLCTLLLKKLTYYLKSRKCCVSFVESKECLTCHIQLFISHNILSWMTLATFIKLSSLLQHKACIYLLLLWLFSFLQMQLGLFCSPQFIFVSFFNGWNSQEELSSILMFVPCSVKEPNTDLWLT